MRFKDSFSTLLVVILIFFLPVNIYVIGDFLGSGIQWAFLRYQQTYLGISVISIFYDIQYVMSGLFSGRTALYIILWSIGACILVLTLILVVMKIKKEIRIKQEGILLVAGGAAFLCADFAQYGLFLNGPSGYVVPIGVPLIWFVGWWITRYQIND